MSGVFVSVGSMMPFDRLVRAIDELAAANSYISTEIKIGRDKYEPRYAKFVRMIPVAECRARVAAARLFVAHAGMGLIISAIEAGKPLLMLAWLRMRGEHNTGRQLATTARSAIRPGLHVAADVPDLEVRATALLAEAGTAPAAISRFADPASTSRIRAFTEAL